MGFSSKTGHAGLPQFVSDVDKPSWQDINHGNRITDRFLRVLRYDLTALETAVKKLVSKAVPSLSFTSHDLPAGASTTVQTEEVLGGYVIDFGLPVPREGAKDYRDLTNKPDLHPVALTGQWVDLEGEPPVSTVGQTGQYSDLVGAPTLADIATTGDYDDLTGKPTLAPVATTGDYDDLTSKPTLAAVATSGAWTDISDRPTLHAVATSGDYSALQNKPTIPSVTATKRVVGAAGEPGFESGWSEALTLVAPFFTKVGNVVHLGGYAARAAGGGNAFPIYTLPTDHRPTDTVYRPVAAGGAFGLLRIQPTGQITLDVGIAGDWVSLGCSFVI